MLKKYYRALISAGRLSRPTYDETRQDVRRMLTARALGSEWNAGTDRRNLRRI